MVASVFRCCLYSEHQSCWILFGLLFTPSIIVICTLIAIPPQFRIGWFTSNLFALLTARSRHASPQFSSSSSLVPVLALGILSAAPPPRFEEQKFSCASRVSQRHNTLRDRSHPSHRSNSGGVRLDAGRACEHNPVRFRMRFSGSWALSC